MESARSGWPLTFATAFALVFIAFGIWAFWTNLIEPRGIDFLSFWSAGRLVLEGDATAAYNIAVHRLVEQSIVPHVGLIPFPYPPPFLAVVAPLALMPFSVAFILWVVLTSIVYAVASARVVSLPYAFANPPILVDFMIGQTGLLVGGLFILGVTLLSTAPLAAGAILGLLVLKPQLALMLPVATIAGRRWKVLAGAVLSSVAVLIAGLLSFGRECYEGFFALLPHYAGFIRNSSWNWVELASPFAFARYIGIAQSPALIIHGIVAIAAAGLTWIAWSRDWEEKTPILAAASLLASPYLLTYDAILLIIPAGLLLRQQRFWSVALLWILCALPVVHFYGLYEGPNTIPVAAILSLTLVSAPHLPRGWRP